jgi:hypothetical protein
MLTRTAVRTRNYFLLWTEVRADVSNAAKQRVSQNVELFWGNFWTRFRGIGPQTSQFRRINQACPQVTRNVDQNRVCQIQLHVSIFAWAES